MQVASGSTLTPAQVDGFLLLVQQLASYKNRNSRNVGEQFKQFPGKDRLPDFYTKPGLKLKCLDMVADTLRARQYHDASQVYFDLHWTFRSVAEVAGRSNVTFRDALKMESILDEFWANIKLLPPLSSLDPAIRALPREHQQEIGAGSPNSSAKPSPAPQLANEHISGSPSPAPGAGPYTSHRATPSVAGVLPAHSAYIPATPVTTSERLQGSAPVHAYGSQPTQHPSNTQGYTFAQLSGGQAHPAAYQAQWIAQMHVNVPSSILFPIPSGANGLEIPSSMPVSVMSSEARKRLQDRQDAIIAAQGRLFNGKKRKRDLDEVPDESSEFLEPYGSGGGQKRFCLDLIARLKAEKEPETGRTLTAPILALPSQEKFPSFYQYITMSQPPTINSVEKHTRTNPVNPAAFDAEFGTIFGNGRIWPAAGMNSSDGEALPPFYGDILCLQRMYQEMTKGRGQILEPDVRAQDLASVPYGPGFIPLETVYEGDKTRNVVTMSSNRIPSSQKTFLEYINYKEEQYSAGDFIHLFNPSNPRLPIIAQIFKCYRKNDTGDRYVTVNWYYRPSETIHMEDRIFYEQEVFKTSLFIDHKAEDIIERICVMHISEYTKGRWDYWEDHMPLYVVEHRWNIDTNSFSKIKNWLLCIPEDSAPDTLTFRLFVDNLPELNKIKSPFYRDVGIKGPGQIGSPFVEEAKDQNDHYKPLRSWAEATGKMTDYARLVNRKRLAEAILSKEDKEGDRRTPNAGPSAAAAKRQNKQHSETPVENGAAGPEKPSKADYEASTPAEHAALLERFEPLPDSIKSNFRVSPETGELLWFTAPPLEIAESSKKHSAHSLEYLAHLAKQLGY